MSTQESKRKSEFLTPQLDTRRIIGDNKFILLQEFKYYSELLEAEVVVPVGYRTDFASIPWFAQSIVQVNNETIHPAVIHDYLCDTDQYSQKIIDRVFLEALEVVQSRITKRIAMFSMVRLYQRAKVFVNKFRSD